MRVTDLASFAKLITASNTDSLATRTKLFFPIMGP